MATEEYIDDAGYQRKHSDLTSRNRAYIGIYLPNKEKFKYPFSYYEVHHKDLNKQNNKISNLQIVTPQEHDEIHEEINRNKISNLQIVTPQEHDEIHEEINRKLAEIRKKREEIEMERIRSQVIRYVFTCSKCGCHSYDMLKEAGKICFGCFNFELNQII